MANLQDLLIFAWAAVWFGWFSWVLLKLNQFDAQTRRQAAISKPQLYDLSKFLIKGTFLATLLLFLPLVLESVLLPKSQIELRQLFQTLPFCLFALIIFVLGILLLQLLLLKSVLNYPTTDKRDVPIPEPLTSPPYLDKSFDQLSRELDESLERLKGET